MARVSRRRYLGGTVGVLGGLLAAACGEVQIRYVEKPVIQEKVVTVEKKVPVIQEKVVTVEKPVVVEKVVEKRVEVPVIKEKVVTVEKPVVVEKPVRVQEPKTIGVLTRAGPLGHTGWYQKTTPKNFTPRYGITVEWIEATGTSVLEKLFVLAAAGTLPEVSWFGVVSDGGRDGAAKGIFKALLPYVQRDKFNLKGYWPQNLAMHTVKGVLYGLPTHGHYGTNVMYINLSLLEQNGLTAPIDPAKGYGDWTTDDLIEMATRVNNPDKGDIGFWPALAINEHGVAYIRTFGGEFLNPEGTKVLLNSEGAQQGFEFVWGTAFKYKVTPQLVPSKGKHPITNFEQGKVAFINWTPGLTARWKGGFKERIKHKLGITMFPKGPTGLRGTQASGAGMGLTGYKNLDAGWEWIKFITNKENGVLQVQGGAGSPGARPDVWGDKRLLDFDPIYGQLQKEFGEPGPLYYPHNERYFELTGTINKTLRNGLYQNKVSVRAAAEEVTRLGNAVLAKPAP